MLASSATLLRRGACAAAGLSTLAEQLSAASSLLSLVQLPGCGRSLVAQQDIPRGTPVWREAPLLASPPPAALASACGQCLRPLPAAQGAPGNGDDPRFCSDACEGDAAQEWLPEWQRARSFQRLLAACRESGEKFPLLAARLACVVIQRQAQPASGGRGPPGDASRGDPVTGVQHLCFANIREVPPPWLELHAGLLEDLREGAAAPGRGAAHAAWLEAHFTPDWLVYVLSRLHLNCFRVDTVPHLDASDYTAMLRAAVAAAGGGGAAAGGHQPGTAAFQLASMFNHSCEPNLDVTWPGNRAVVEMRAARDVAAGEQLTISYTDETQGREERQAALRFAYGFDCGCHRCQEERPVTMNLGKGALACLVCALGLAAAALLQPLDAVLRQPGVEAPEPKPTPKPDDWWQAAHKHLVEEVAAADEGQGFGLIFYGDSITESWRGTDGGESPPGRPCPRCQGAPEVFAKHYGKYNATPLAIGGDQTAHLIWRLQNGEIPQKNMPKVVVLLIGTNDLGAAHGEGDPRGAEERINEAVPGVLQRYIQIVRLLRDGMPDTQLLLLALTPRGWGRFVLPSEFSAAFELVNAHLRAYAADDGRVHFIDCGDRFLTPDGKSIDAGLLPDALHPNAAGYELLAECLDPAVADLYHRPAGGAQAVSLLAESSSSEASRAKP